MATTEIQKATADYRVETGPVRFGADWPGLFIRGDDALAFQVWLDKAATLIEGHDPESKMARRKLYEITKAIHDIIVPLEERDANGRPT
jgi:hypothetical protein